MSNDTDASELSRRRLYDLGRLDQEYNQKYYAQKGGIFNGSTKFINAMLTIIVLLLAAAITGQINFNMHITDEVSQIKTTLDLLIDGRIKEKGHD